MKQPTLRLTDARYAYPRGGFILRCDDLAFYPGELACVVGKNGSGKSTLMALFCGILRPQQGELRIRGELANDLSLGQIGKTVGYMLQNPARQLFATNVWEEMTFIDDIKGNDPQETARRATRYLERFGLLPLKDRSIYRLSRGEKQRLVLCAILMQGASHLILDEPTTGLDSQNRAVLHDTLRELLTAGIGISVVTHDQGFLREFGRRVVRVEGGEVVADERQ